MIFAFERQPPQARRQTRRQRGTENYHRPCERTRRSAEIRHTVTFDSGVRRLLPKLLLLLLLESLYAPETPCQVLTTYVEGKGGTHRVQQLDRHLDVGRLAGDDDQTFALAACRRRRAVHAHAHRTRLHDLDLARAHMPNLVDLSAAFADDTPDKVVGDVDLLRLQLRRRCAGRRRIGVVGSCGSVARDPVLNTKRHWLYAGAI